MTNVHNGEIEFPPLAGKAVVRFTVGNMIALEERFRRDYDRDIAGKEQDLNKPTFVGWLIGRVGGGSPSTLAECLARGLKQPGGKKPYDFDPLDPPFPFSHIDTVMPVLDALNLAANGETYQGAIKRLVDAEMAKREAAEADGEDPSDPVPPTSPET